VPHFFRTQPNQASFSPRHELYAHMQTAVTNWQLTVAAIREENSILNYLKFNTLQSAACVILRRYTAEKIYLQHGGGNYCTVSPHIPVTEVGD